MTGRSTSLDRAEQQKRATSYVSMSRARQRQVASQMPILAVGVSHEQAPVELRERLAFPTSHLDDAYSRLRALVAEGVILSTCNRTEVYANVEHVGSAFRA